MNTTPQTTAKILARLAKLSSSATDHMGPEQFPWDHVTLSQVLLPSLCAIFITVVVVVIACCLIQKKTKGADQLCKEKSCLTIDTSSHETWDGGIYDVIDEVNICGETFSGKRAAHRQEQPGIPCISTPSQRLAQRPTGTALHSPLPAFPCNLLLKGDTLPQQQPVSTDPVTKMYEPQTRNCGNMDMNKSFDTFKEEEEGIYETLDRYWTFKNANMTNKRTTTQQNTVTHLVQARSMDKHVKQSAEQVTANSVHMFGLRQTILKDGSNVFNRPESLSLSSRGQVESETMLCQIRFLTTSPCHYSPHVLHTAMYHVHIQPPAYAPATSGHISPLLPHNGSLRIVPEPSLEGDAQKEKVPELILKPVEVKELQKHVQFSDSPVQNEQKQNYGRRPGTKIYEKPYSSKRTPILLAKKSESFRDATSEMKAMKDSVHVFRRSSDSCHVDLRVTRDHVTSNGSKAPAEVEVKRILTKLGPLPPLPPVQTGQRSTIEHPHSSGHKSELELSKQHQLTIDPLQYDDNQPVPALDNNTNDSSCTLEASSKSQRSESKCASQAARVQSPLHPCMTLDPNHRPAPPQLISAETDIVEQVRFTHKSFDSDKNKLESCGPFRGMQQNTRKTGLITNGIDFKSENGRRSEKGEEGERKEVEEEDGNKEEDVEEGGESSHYFELEPCLGSVDSLTSYSSEETEEDVRSNGFLTFCNGRDYDCHGQIV